MNLQQVNAVQCCKLWPQVVNIIGRFDIKWIEFPKYLRDFDQTSTILNALRKESQIFSFRFESFLSLLTKATNLPSLSSPKHSEPFLSQIPSTKTFFSPDTRTLNLISFHFSSNLIFAESTSSLIETISGLKFFNKRKHFVALVSFSSCYYCTLPVYPFSDASRRGVLLVQAL